MTVDTKAPLPDGLIVLNIVQERLEKEGALTCIEAHDFDTIRAHIEAQAAEIERLKSDLSSYATNNTELVNENERLRGASMQAADKIADLSFELGREKYGHPATDHINDSVKMVCKACVGSGVYSHGDGFDDNDGHTNSFCENCNGTGKEKDKE